MKHPNNSNVLIVFLTFWVLNAIILLDRRSQANLKFKSDCFLFWTFSFWRVMILLQLSSWILLSDIDFSENLFFLFSLFSESNAFFWIAQDLHRVTKPSLVFDCFVKVILQWNISAFPTFFKLKRNQSNVW